MATFDWSKLAPFVKSVKTACGSGVLAMGVAVKNDVVKSFPAVGKFSSSSAGSPPAKHRNLLSNSIQTEMGGPLFARVGSNVAYGPVHEFGVPSKEVPAIRAKNVKYLPIPVNEAAKRLMQRKALQSLRVMGNFRFFMSKKNNLIMIGDKKERFEFNAKDSAGKTIRVRRSDLPVFVLKKSITMPKRPFMAPALARARNNNGLTVAFANATTEALVASGIHVQVKPV